MEIEFNKREGKCFEDIIIVDVIIN